MKLPLHQRSRSQYRGRFAPSPSGLLHFGSLVTAVASYLHAKANQGKWLIRIEDIDPPREQPGASNAILETLEAYGLYWDETELYQSSQSKLYQEVLAYLAEQKLSYHCQCTRAQIKASGGIYQGTCRSRKLPAENSAVRLINHHGINSYQDIIQGHVQCDQLLAQEDFTIVRKDGLFAYQLAVVVDDIFQGITHIIRGCDLLEPTARQLTFFKTLNFEEPQYGHVPLAVTEQGYKLSKQNKAPAIDLHKPQPSLIAALAFLGQQPDSALLDCAVEEILNWAQLNWRTDKVPAKPEIMLTDQNYR